MPYYLWKAVLDRSPRLEISHSEYDDIVAAWGWLTAIVKIEEVWDNLVQNYLDLERDLLSYALEDMVLNDGAYEYFHQMRLLFSRRLSNLLSSARSYLDHTPQLLRMLPGADYAGIFRAATNDAYDGQFGYRFMEALRNYAQHCGAPLHGVTIGGAWIERDGERMALLRHAVAASINLEDLKASGKFKASILGEIGTDCEKLDVAKTTREYVEGIGSIHTKLRDALKSPLGDWLEEVRRPIAWYATENAGNTLARIIRDVVRFGGPRFSVPACM